MMRLVLAEEQGSELRLERTFTNPVIKIGRDPAECQLVFEQAQWPMVSRRHAEFHCQDGNCLVVDTNSSFGTLVEGKRISGSVPVKSGDRVQFGLSGPIVRVVRIENASAGESHSELSTPVRPLSVPGAANQARPVSLNGPGNPQPLPVSSRPVTTPQGGSARPPATPISVSTEVFLEHQSGVGAGTQRIKLATDKFTLGRDPGMDLVIDLDSAVVSRRHAEIKRESGQYMLVDSGSFNGTLINEQRITAPTPLYDQDEIQLGPGGPVLRFIAPMLPAPLGSHLPAQRAAVSSGQAAPPPLMPVTPAGRSAPSSTGREYQGTMVLRADSVTPPSTTPVSSDQLLMQLPFAERREITIGRSPENTIRLDGLQISNRHARIAKEGTGLTVEDTGSTNGIYVNGKRLTVRKPSVIVAEDLVQIGPFRLTVDAQAVSVFDTRAKTRVDVLDIIKRVPNRSGAGEVLLLDDVDLTIQPNEFVGLLGPSGAGKSTLMDAMNGMRPATSGQILINGLNLYENLDSFKQSIGYVPQEDIIHRELTVYRTLYYVAKLRLSRDVSDAEINQIINEVLDVTGLAERHDVCVGQLSGGQRKRVSIAVELITKPSIIYLDEPTSGLDPATEEKIMRLFRQIAESGRTVILTTHAMENVKLFDKIVVLMRGKLVWYGPPMEALKHFKADSFKDLYDKIEAPASKVGAGASKGQREALVEKVADEWRVKFSETPQYQQLILDPLGKLKGSAPPPVPARRSASVTDSVRQLKTLAQRYKEVLFRDKMNLAILLGQAPLIALLTALVTGSNDPRDFPLFMLSLVAIWFGTSIASREIIRERPVYNRERMVNLGLLPYVGSKLLVLSVIVSVQCIMLFVTLKLLDLASPVIAAIRPDSAFTMPGYLIGIPQLAVMVLTGIVGVMIGLFISSVVKTSEMATSLVPLILIPQLLFAGLVGLPTGLAKVVGLAMPATWSFDEMKRLSGLEVLRGQDEGGAPSDLSEGKGLYKRIEQENKDKIDKAQRDIGKYKRSAEQDGRAFKRKMQEYANARAAGDNSVALPDDPSLPPEPAVSAPSNRPDTLKGYVDFLHPWGNLVWNPLALILMFFALLAGTLFALRSQDIG